MRVCGPIDDAEYAGWLEVQNEAYKAWLEDKNSGS